MWSLRKRRDPAAPAVQLRSWEQHPFGALREYVPLGRGEARLYRAVREAVPVVDAALYKLIRMTGGAAVRCGDGAAEAAPSVRSVHNRSRICRWAYHSRYSDRNFRSRGFDRSSIRAVKSRYNCS